MARLPRLQVFGEPAPDLVEDEADERLGARDVAGRHDEVERHRQLALDQILDAPLAGARDLGDDGIAIDMGTPRFGWDQIPLAFAMDTAPLPVAWDGLGQGSAVNVGNPHVIFFVDDLEAVDLAAIGPVIEHDPLFPERVNVNVAQVTGPASLRLSVWERGAGLTRACGTGACATAVAAIRRGLVASPVRVTLPGGDLSIGWAPGGSIRMTGPATHVFSGEADLEAFG